ncbi:hypothetical protein SUDANB51_06975 [Streptomyces sp. enrichment culture]
MGSSSESLAREWCEKLLDAYPAETGMPPRILGEALDKLYE